MGMIRPSSPAYQNRLLEERQAMERERQRFISTQKTGSPKRNTSKTDTQAWFAISDSLKVTLAEQEVQALWAEGFELGILVQRQIGWPICLRPECNSMVSEAIKRGRYKVLVGKAKRTWRHRPAYWVKLKEGVTL
jgi:hypothetical protein